MRDEPPTSSTVASCPGSTAADTSARCNDSMVAAIDGRRSLAHLLPYGLTGRRGCGLVLALACLVPWVEAFGPWADTLMDLLYI